MVANMLREPGNLRRRRGEISNEEEHIDRDEGTEDKPETPKKRDLAPNTYWLARIILLRSVCFVYFVAFLVAIHQNWALIGPKGLLPVPKFLRQIKNIASGDLWEQLQHAPTLLWFLDWEQYLQYYLDVMMYAGLMLSAFVVITGCANMVVMLILWMLYHSVVNIGQRWYSFGWESQLLETGFLAIFLCPVLSLQRIPRLTPPSIIVIWAFRWLIFRIMLGAGLIKIRGDKCWRDLTCMNYHYQTQPVPNPLAYFMHQTPEPFHKFEVLTNHFVELVAPFFLAPFLPRPFRLVGGFIQILFQVVLILSGNLSFLNWLTIVPSLACFDDRSLAWMFSDKPTSARGRVWAIQQEERAGKAPRVTLGQKLREGLTVLFGLLILWLSVPVIKNMISSAQKMNRTYDVLRLVNSYGKFGSVTKQRTEVILQGTYDGPNNPNAIWHEYEFKCKPGNVSRAPCVISPYHYRLDWLMWFAAFGNYQEHPWLTHLAAKLLANDPAAESLIEHNPFHGKTPPRWIRAEHYRYTYTKIGSREAAKGNWWRRKRIGSYMPPISLDTIKDYLKAMKWEQPLIQRPSTKATKATSRK